MARKGLVEKINEAIYAFWKTVLTLVWKGLLFLGKSIIRLFSSVARKAKQPSTKAVFSSLIELKHLEGDLRDFEKQLLESKSLIGIIIGARGSGKSGLGMRLLENAHSKGKKVAAMGFSQESVPSWVKIVSDLKQVNNGSFLLVDEGGILFSSRSSFSDANKLLSELLFIARHKDLSVVFISQNSSNLEINTLRQADYLLLRKPSLLQKDFERKIIQKIYSLHEKEFKELGKYATLVYSDWYKGFVENELPSFWSEKASKSFKDFNR